MPEELNFEELSSDHLFSLDFDTLYNLDDVRSTCFLSWRWLLTVQKPLMGFDKAFQSIHRSTVAGGMAEGPFVSEPW